MKQSIAIVSPTCLAAAKAYIDLVSESVGGVIVSDAGDDDWDGCLCGIEVRFSGDDRDGEIGQEGDSYDDSAQPCEPEGGVARCVWDTYLRTIRLLGRNEAAAAAWLSRRGLAAERITECMSATVG